MTELTDLSETDASNTTITGANIAEGCPPSGINNAIRNLSGLIRRAFKASIFRVRDTTDQTKLLALDLSGITTATTRTLVVPDASGTIGLVSSTTWTPALTIGGSTTGITYSSQLGRYQKVGNKVTLWVYIILTSKGVQVGTISVTGIPFTAKTDAGMFWANAVGYRNNSFTGAGILSAGTSIFLYNGDTALNNGDITNTTTFAFTLEYEAAS